ncbi:MSRA4 [Auxenochlorella protothecoides x Auxenochlorella symbiontica]
MAEDMATWRPEGRLAGHEVATFAGGCFWSVQLAFDRLHGVLSSSVGYAQGQKQHPTYKEVCTGTTGHSEAVQLVYDPEQITYAQLLDALFEKIDPLQREGQGADVGSQYRTGIYTHSQVQAQAAKQKVASVEGCAVEVEPFTVFWPAEEYHQRYLEKGGSCRMSQSAAKGCKEPIRCYG